MSIFIFFVLGAYLVAAYSVIQELRTRFQKAVETGDDSYIPPDLLNVTYVTVSVSQRRIFSQSYHCPHLSL